MAQTEQIFANNFWGLKDDGFHVLTAKMNSTKKTFDEIKSFYNVRASLHEEFGRKLMKHAKVGMGREETGTLQALLASAHKETEWAAQAHLNLAQKLKTRLEVDLDNFILEQKDKRKLAHTNVEKAHRYKQSNEAYLSKVKEKYESDCAKLITLQTQVAGATGREAERIKQRIDRTQHEIKIQEQEYKNACIKVADATEAWNRTWKMTCDTYQRMEKKRLEFLHHSFSMYINVLSTASSQDQESFERFWKSLDQYHPVGDIQVFIKEKGTGPQIPEPEIFVDYMDDPTKTFQQHTVANFPCPPELLTSTSSPIEPQPKVELTVRNPSTSMNSAAPASAVAAVASSQQQQQQQQQQDKSVLLQRVRSLKMTLNSSASSNATISEPPTPSKSTTAERKRSILKTTIKPLPSISTPLMQQPKSSRHQRKSSTHENYCSRSQQPIPPPPVLVVPEISSSSTTSASSSEGLIEEEEQQQQRSTIATRRVARKKKVEEEEEEGDISIDPRAKVVFAIGNNMFDLGHLDLEQDDDSKKVGLGNNALNGGHNTTTTSTTRRLTTTTRRRKLSADLEAACNFSYKSLLEELGVFDKSGKGDGSSGSSATSGSSTQLNGTTRSNNEIAPLSSSTTEKERSNIVSRRIPKRMSLREKRPMQQEQHMMPLQQQPQNQQQTPLHATTTVVSDGYNHHNYPPYMTTNIAPTPIMTNNLQQDMYNINPNDPYNRKQQQQHQYYNNQYPTRSPVSAMSHQQQHHQQPTNMMYHTGTSPNTYNAPPNVIQSGHQPTLFWVTALGDWYTGKPEELQYSMGTWMAVTETRPDGWYYATKYDSRLNMLTNEKGYVAQNYVQVHPA